MGKFVVFEELLQAAALLGDFCRSLLDYLCMKSYDDWNLQSHRSEGRGSAHCVGDS